MIMKALCTDMMTTDDICHGFVEHISTIGAGQGLLHQKHDFCKINWLLCHHLLRCGVMLLWGLVVFGVVLWDGFFVNIIHVVIARWRGVLVGDEKVWALICELWWQLLSSWLFLRLQWGWPGLIPEVIMSGHCAMGDAAW